MARRPLLSSLSSRSRLTLAITYYALEPARGHRPRPTPEGAPWQRVQRSPPAWIPGAPPPLSLRPPLPALHRATTLSVQTRSPRCRRPKETRAQTRRVADPAPKPPPVCGPETWHAGTWERQGGPPTRCGGGPGWKAQP